MVPPAPSAPPPASPPELFRTLRWPLLGAAWAFFCLGGLLVLFVYVRRRRRQRAAFETERRLSEHTAPAPQPPPPPQIQQQQDTDANTVAVARAIFDRYDADGSGKIDALELRACCAELGHDLDDDALAKAIVALDEDASGCISEAEFCQWVKLGLSVDALLNTRAKAVVERGIQFSKAAAYPEAQKGDDRPPDDERAVIRETEAALAAQMTDAEREAENARRKAEQRAELRKLRRSDTGDYGKGAPSSQEKIVQARIARSKADLHAAQESGTLSRWFSASFGRVFTGGREADGSAPAKPRMTEERAAIVVQSWARVLLARHAANDVLVRPRHKLLRGEPEMQRRASRRLSAALQETNEWLAACQAQAASEAAVAAPAVAAPAAAAPAELEA